MRVVAVCLAESLLFNPALAQSSAFGQKANDEEKYSASLVVVPLAKSPKYLKYQDGRQQVIYSTESEYPAEVVLSFISAELKKRGWKPLPQDFFNPDLPSSHQRGWTFFEDHTQEPWTGVYAWNADWENGSHDIVVYVLRYESPDNSTRNLKNLQVIELFIPSDIAAKMRLDAVNASGIHTFKPSDTKHTNAKIIPEKLVKTVPPVYPPEAGSKGISGTVRVLFAVGGDGLVYDAHAISGEGLSEDPSLRKAAEEAVLQWRYQPTTIDGMPARTDGVTADIIFSPKN
jgi:TonB family protein